MTWVGQELDGSPVPGSGYLNSQMATHQLERDWVKMSTKPNEAKMKDAISAGGCDI